jgi:Ca2+-binding RTX toxin-like protein
MSVDDLLVDGQGRLVAGGWSGGAAVFRMRPGGGADRTFGAGAPVKLPSSGPASGIALQANGKIVVLGEPCCGPKSASLYRLTGGTDHTRCLGHKATIVGTNGADEITGTPHRDVIAALGGRDKVRGLGGPDVICGGKGKDDLFGGPGRNEVKP